MRGEYKSARRSCPAPTELPPRARRILLTLCLILFCLGTTSACAENTLSCTVWTPRAWNYLRVRGEYKSRLAYSPQSLELPPRARRIHHVSGVPASGVGTTSACAENTAPRKMRVDTRRNYLRVRGEYATKPSKPAPTWELPPRARRILDRRLALGRVGGTTSACAENTTRANAPIMVVRNYLRVRGEYRDHRAYQPALWELPPRARRIPVGWERKDTAVGTTSACAENTFILPFLPLLYRNYLRVRGEYFAGQDRFLGFGELPPRARRIP